MQCHTKLELTWQFPFTEFSNDIGQNPNSCRGVIELAARTPFFVGVKPCLLEFSAFHVNLEYINPIVSIILHKRSQCVELMTILYFILVAHADLEEVGPLGHLWIHGFELRPELEKRRRDVSQAIAVILGRSLTLSTE